MDLAKSGKKITAKLKKAELFVSDLKAYILVANKGLPNNVMIGT